ncbi:MAG: hypothetical protein HY562_09560, partial [Ignavibacteriales bacterium]|nr:hypothetical protein [Ignavibacteriales bacterium]
MEKRSVSVDAYARVLKPTFGAKIVRYARVHPARVASGGILAAAIALVMLQLTHKPVDVNPTYIEIKNSVLTAYNQAGTPLWEKAAQDMPTGNSKEEFLSPLGRGISPNLVALVDDIDGNGTNEVLLTSPSVSENLRPAFAPDSLYCFNSNGSFRWKAGFSENRFAEDFPYTRWATWKPRTFFALTDRNTRRRLFVNVNCIGYFPSKLIEIDATSGEVLQTYWHA